MSGGMLDRLLGNEALREQLSGALARGHLPHSILLVGEPGCGAGFAARCLAADYLFPTGGAQAEDTVAGNVCQVLPEGEEGRVETGKVREVLSVRPGGKAGFIRVSQIRAARSEIFKSSLSAEGRVILLSGAQNMNQGAANAFLKVLEEPPEGALFLLTANGLAGVLPTIRSRCCAYTVAPISAADCAAALRQKMPGLSAAETGFLARVHGGKLGACLRAAAPQRRQSLSTAQELFELLAAGDEYGALACLAQAEKDKEQAQRLVEDITALCAAGLRDPAFAPGTRGGKMSPARAAAVIREAGTFREVINGNGNLRLALTLFGARALR